MELSHISNCELLSDVRSLVGEERATTAKLVAYLAEVEERRLHLMAGFPSMFAFCTRELGMSENAAFRRLVAARLGRRFPVIHSLLASGNLHLSALELLREHLTEDNHAELLEAVGGRSKNEILVLLAARFPKPDVPSTVRKLPQRAAKDESGNRASLMAEASQTVETLALTSPRTIASRRARIEPLSEARYRVEFTASAEFREKLELCRDLMSHANPTRELEVVVERAIDLLLAELEKKRLGRTKQSDDAESGPGRPAAPEAKLRRVPRATRRLVFERDGLKCTYVSPDGRRCESRAFLELDHVEPRALGGAHSVENLRVRCRAHNQFSAEQVFGREQMVSCRRFVRQKSARHRTADEVEKGAPIVSTMHSHTVAPSNSVGPDRNGCDRLETVEPIPRERDRIRHVETNGPPNACERITSALRTMGFRAVEARAAIARVASLHDDLEALPIEQTLREALLAATPRASSLSPSPRKTVTRDLACRDAPSFLAEPESEENSHARL